MASTPTQNIPYLDGWRGLAVTLLLIGHFYPVPGIDLGTVGVNLFFVLSGLLMTRILFVKGVDIPTFYRRRVSRILPSVLAFLVIITLWFVATGREVNWSQVAAAATFTNNYNPGAIGTRSMPFGHIWSLSVEEHSYILLSIIAIAARHGAANGRTAVGTAALMMASMGTVYWLMFTGTTLTGMRMHSEVAAFGIFASGFALLYMAGQSKAPLGVLVVPSLLGLGFAAHWWRVPPPVLLVVGCGAFALAINLLDRAPPLVRWFLELRPLRQLGTWSFSIYLWQQPFCSLTDEHGIPRSARLILALIVGITAYYAIENPARLYLNRVWVGRKIVPMGSNPLPPSE